MKNENTETVVITRAAKLHERFLLHLSYIGSSYNHRWMERVDKDAVPYWPANGIYERVVIVPS